MSTPNFEFMKYDMPLIIADTDYYQMKEDYEKEFNEEYTEDMFEDDCYYIADNMRRLAENFTKTLNYHTVDIQDGYYSGIQFIVYENNECLFDLSKDGISNEDAQYYYGECRSKVIRKADAEKRKIYKWLKSMKDYGYLELSCDGVFSNGEAVYSIVH